LPENGFVYCCFNNNFKITPEIFDIWMRVLHSVPDSVLWLLEDNATAAKQLRIEATQRCINPERLVFAPRMTLAEHLARHRLADVFIDTYPCNAHTTASDALWAGLPVVTLMGNSFAGRVAASLLNGIQLPELITGNAQAYEALLIELGKNPRKLHDIKQQLAQNRLSAPLFDTPKYCRHLESAYEKMVEQMRNHSPKSSIAVEP
jgi:predicted O-linked N-acetylglucosamine transferase (SPINDLY family)